MEKKTFSNTIIKEMPEELRPRERLMRYGVSALSDYELLAIILRTGTKELSVLELAKQVITEFKNLGEFRNITVNELCMIKGIKQAKAVEVLASIELGKRIQNYEFNERLIDIAICDGYLFAQKPGSFERTNISLNSTEKVELVATDFKMIVSDKNTLIVCNDSYARFLNFNK